MDRVERVARRLAAFAFRRLLLQSDPGVVLMVYPNGESDYIERQWRRHLEDAQSVLDEAADH